MGAVVEGMRDSPSCFSIVTSQAFVSHDKRQVISHWGFPGTEPYVTPHPGRWVCVVGRLDMILEHTLCFRVCDFICGDNNLSDGK